MAMLTNSTVSALPRPTTASPSSEWVDVVHVQNSVPLGMPVGLCAERRPRRSQILLPRTSLSRRQLHVSDSRDWWSEPEVEARGDSRWAGVNSNDGFYLHC